MTYGRINKLQITIVIGIAALFSFLFGLFAGDRPEIILINFLLVVPIIILVTSLISSPISQFLISKNLTHIFVWIVLGFLVSQIVYPFHLAFVFSTQSAGEAINPAYVLEILALYAIAGGLSGMLFSIILQNTLRREINNTNNNL